MLTAGLAKLVGGVAMAACVVVALSPRAQAQELKAWRHSLIAPKADAGFFYMAAERGFFEREGLKVETLEVKDDAIGIKALLSREVDSHEGTAGAIAAAARGADVRILGCPWHGVPYVVLARPGIASMEQMRGKSIAASSPGTPPEMMARASLALFKIAPSEVKPAAVGGDRDRYAALLGGVVDAAVVSNEYMPLPQTKNLKVLVQGRDALPKSVRFCVQMTGKTLATRHDDAVRFMTAEIKAWRYAVAHRDETIKLTMETTDAKVDDPRPAFVFDDAVNNGIVKSDLPIPAENLAWMQEQMVALGQIPKAGDIGKIVSPEIRAEALRRIDKVTLATAAKEFVMGEVSLVDVSKRFSLRIDGEIHNVQALDRVNFTVGEGEIVTLIGPSGCGKTTALRIAMGLETASGGKVMVDGREVRGCGFDRGMVFQFAELLPWLSALQNVMFGLEMKGVRGPELRETAARYLELVGLSDSINRRPHQLSGGMKQRVGIARALAVDPKVLLMDEPFGALDAQTRETMQAELLDIHARTRKTILFVTHDLDEAVLIADRIVVMKNGMVQEIVTVPLARPRPDLGMVRGMAEFNETRYRVWKALHEPAKTVH